MRCFRFLLPLTNVILALLLFYWGDIQVRRILRAEGGAPEGITEISAKARYLDYAINAPVWALLRGRHTLGMLWSPSTYWKGENLYYLIAVAVLWFLVGACLDRRFGNKSQPRNRGRQWWNKILAFAFALYGLFVCYEVLPIRPAFMSYGDYVRSYLPTMFNMLHGAGWWWITFGLVWGVGLIVTGLTILRRSRGRLDPEGSGIVTP